MMRKVMLSLFSLLVFSIVGFAAAAVPLPSGVAQALHLTIAAVPGGDAYSNEADVEEGSDVRTGSMKMLVNCDADLGYRRETEVLQMLQAGNFATADVKGFPYASNAARCALGVSDGHARQIFADQAADFQIELLTGAHAQGLTKSMRYVTMERRVKVIADWLRATSSDATLRDNAAIYLHFIACPYHDRKC